MVKETCFYGKVSIDSYTYQEDIPQIDWVLSDSTKMICGFLCHQATAVFRGRNWIAWFCDTEECWPLEIKWLTRTNS